MELREIILRGISVCVCVRMPLLLEIFMPVSISLAVNLTSVQSTRGCRHSL